MRVSTPPSAAESSSEQAGSIVLGNLFVDVHGYRVTVDGEPVDLTYHEFELLSLLCRQPGRIIAYQALTEPLFGDSGRPAIRHLNVVVHRLRTKLAGLCPYAIETVRGRGYGLLRPAKLAQNLPRDGP